MAYSNVIQIVSEIIDRWKNRGSINTVFLRLSIFEFTKNDRIARIIKGNEKLSQSRIGA